MGWVVCHNGPKTSACTSCMQHYADKSYDDKYAEQQCTTHGRNGDSNGGSKGISSFNFSGSHQLESNEICHIAYQWPWKCIAAKEE